MVAPLPGCRTYIGAFKVPLLRAGFRKVVFSIIIMAVVLFYRQGIMGDRELNFDRILRKRQKFIEKRRGGQVICQKTYFALTMLPCSSAA